MRRLLVVFLAASCGAPPPAQQSGAEAISQDNTLSFVALVEPQLSTTLRAPQNVFIIGGWRSISSWTKLSDIDPEGKHVKKGDVVARFNFRFKKAKFWVDKRIREAKAEQSQSQVTNDRALAALLHSQADKRLAVDTAHLDTLKATAISQLQLKLYQIDHEVAKFELGAVSKRIKSYRVQKAAEAAYYRARVARHEYELDRYHAYQNRYVVRAPHDGVVRHARHVHRSRKIKKGDGMPAGMPVIHLARDERLVLRVLVPEAHLTRVKVGARLAAVIPGSSQRVSCVVKRIEQFPQEMGFLRKDDKLPGARDKAYAVIAELAEQPQGLSAGTEIRVELRP